MYDPTIASSPSPSPSPSPSQSPSPSPSPSPLPMAVAATISPPVDYPAPSTLGITLANPVLAGGKQGYADCLSAGSPCVTGSPKTVSDLVAADYDVWAGSCTTDAGQRPNPPVVATALAGGTRSVTVSTARIKVRAWRNNNNGSKKSYVQVAETLWARDACGYAFSLVTTSTTTWAQASLPAGTWTVYHPTLASDTGSWPSVTLTLPDSASSPAQAEVFLAR